MKKQVHPENWPYANRTRHIPRSFIREILKTASSPDMISFAGGLPDEKLIPVEGLRVAFDHALRQHGRSIFQYANTEGLLPLREWIARRYRENHNIPIRADEILITSGSQQGIDLLGKVFLDKGDKVILEQPAYLGTLQALSHFEPEMVGVPMEDDGIQLGGLQRALLSKVKMIQLIPDFQNPSGISYSLRKRQTVAEWTIGNGCVLVEDAPYQELFFERGSSLPPIMKWMNGESILLGSFSKTISPGLRLGWLAAKKETMEKLIIAKQSADLHSNTLAQAMIYSYLTANDYEGHLEQIRRVYGERKEMMIEAIGKYLPLEIYHTNPTGGMFLWLRLPSHISAMALVKEAMARGVAMVPGGVFYIDGHSDQEVRLNFSRSEEGAIKRGMQLISKSIESLNSGNKVYLNSK